MKVFILVGCPGSGKTWVADRLTEQFKVIRHDDYMKNPSAYIAEVLRHGKSSEKPVLAEAPFSVSQIVDPLRVHGLEVECVFIQEDLDTIRDRYIRRECKEIPQGHLTRQSTYLDRAIAMQAYYGTSQEVLNYLKSKA